MTPPPLIRRNQIQKRNSILAGPTSPRNRLNVRLFSIWKRTFLISQGTGLKFSLSRGGKKYFYRPLINSEGSQPMACAILTILFSLTSSVIRLINPLSFFKRWQTAPVVVPLSLIFTLILIFTCLIIMIIYTLAII